MRRRSTAADRRTASLRALTGAALAVAILAVPAVAGWPNAVLAAPAQPNVATPLPTIEAELWPDRQQGLTSLTVLARLPESAKLPVTVEMPLPAGATVTWSGEIDLADETGASDATQTARILTAGGGRAVRLVARKTRLVQYEAVLGPTKHVGSQVTSALDWLQTVPTGSVTVSSRLPLDATQVRITPAPVGDPQRDQQLGQMLYTLAPVQLPVGRTFTVQVRYVAPGQGGGSPPAGAGPTGGVPALLWLLLVAAVAALAVVIAVQRRRREPPALSPDTEDADEDEEPGP